MRLFLSSDRLTHLPPSLLDLVGPAAHVAVVANANDAPGVDRREMVASEIALFTSRGCSAHELDLRDHFDAPAGIDRVLEGIDLVWMMGGNAFLLRRALRRSGLDAVLPDLVRAGTVTFGGYSAGAVVAGSTLRGIDLVDDPSEEAVGYGAAVVWAGLGLIDRAVAPHFDSDSPLSDAVGRAVAFHEQTGRPYRTLRDGEALVVTDIRETLVGEPTHPSSRHPMYRVAATRGDADGPDG